MEGTAPVHVKALTLAEPKSTLYSVPVTLSTARPMGQNMLREVPTPSPLAAAPEPKLVVAPVSGTTLRMLFPEQVAMKRVPVESTAAPSAPETVTEAPSGASMLLATPVPITVVIHPELTL